MDADLVLALRALPSPFRSAVLMSDVHGLTYDQVAAALGIKVGTVRSQIAPRPRPTQGSPGAQSTEPDRSGARPGPGSVSSVNGRLVLTKQARMKP